MKGTEESRRRIIFLLDLDSFYPSVEARERPELRGKPLIVGADPKGGKARGVVVSCSYEARKWGVHSGMPISRAFRLCPDAHYVQPNFALYGKVSTRVMELLKGYTESLEQVSIDEAFLDMTVPCNGSYEEARRLALLIKKELHDKEALSSSIGIACNKSSAKIAADFQKPDGLTIVPPERLQQFLSPLPVSAITGVGKKTEEFLHSIHVNTIGELQKLPGKELVKYFGKTGVWLWGVAHGLEQLPVRSREIMKSLSVEHTFEHDVLSRDVLRQKLEELADKLHSRLRAAGYEYKVVGIKIRFSHFETHSRENTLPTFTNEKEPILQEARNLLREFETNQKKVRLLGVFVAEFVPSELADTGLERWLKERVS